MNTADADNVQPLLLTPEQAAYVLAVSRSTVYELLKSGELYSVKVNGGSRRVRYSDLKAYVSRLK